MIDEETIKAIFGEYIPGNCEGTSLPDFVASEICRIDRINTTIASAFEDIQKSRDKHDAYSTEVMCKIKDLRKLCKHYSTTKHTPHEDELYYICNDCGATASTVKGLPTQ